jgi:thymidylate kinase
MKNIDTAIVKQLFGSIGNPVVDEGHNASLDSNTLYYRNNPDGTIRWVWPVNATQPVFLKFYSATSFKAMMVVFAIQLLFKLKLQGLFASGKLTLWFNTNANAAFINSIGDNWAMFTGTAGVNRTGLIYSAKKDSFYKIAAGSNAVIQLVKEYTALQNIDKYPLTSIEKYGKKLHSKEVLEVQNIGTGGKRVSSLTTQHWNVLADLANTQNKFVQINQIPHWAESIKNIQLLKFNADNRIPRGMVRNLEKLFLSINDSTEIATSLAHNDFTPWNIYVKRDIVALIDWELSTPLLPCLVDAFHFNYQQGVLVESLSLKHLKSKITQAFDNPVAKQIIADNGIDVELHHKLYLLFTASYYLHIYSLQDNWPVQVHKSIALWNDALSDVLAANETVKQRQVLVNNVFDFFQSKNYAALKWLADKPERLAEESDIDLCIDKCDLQSFRNYINNNPLVVKAVERKQSFMSNFAIMLKDNSFLSVDLIWKFKRKEMVMLDAKELLASATHNRFGVKTPAVLHHFNYTWLFYLLNKASMPDKYANYYNSLTSPDKETLNDELCWKSILGFNRVAELYEYNTTNHKAVLSTLKKNAFNTGLNRIVNTVQYALDKLRELRFEKGFIITFSGVDGAGKSTIIEHVRNNIEKKYRRKVVVLRHRPSVLPMLSAWKMGREAAEQRSANTLPRTGNNNSKLSSLFRFAYYYTDYLLGQFVVQAKYVYRGYIVVYDRYYFDFINDAKRSNITLPTGFTRAGYSFLLKPEFNFFLYADAQVILKRKKELDGTTIKALTAKYLRLFDELKRHSFSAKYVAIENESMAETLSTITNHVKTAIL